MQRKLSYSRNHVLLSHTDRVILRSINSKHRIKSVLSNGLQVSSPYICSSFQLTLYLKKLWYQAQWLFRKGPPWFQERHNPLEKKRYKYRDVWCFFLINAFSLAGGRTHILDGVQALYKLPRSSTLTMSSNTPWKRLLLILLQGLLILADDSNSIGLRQIRDGDLSAGPSFVLSGESGGDLIASSWTPNESENPDLAISEAERIDFPAQNQDQKPAKSSKSRKIRRWDHRKRDGADAPPGFCSFDAPWRTQSGQEGQQQVDSGQEIIPATGSSLFPLPDLAFFKLKRYTNIYVCHLLSAGSLQASSPVTYLEPCRRRKFTHEGYRFNPFVPANWIEIYSFDHWQLYGTGGPLALHLRSFPDSWWESQCE